MDVIDLPFNRLLGVARSGIDDQLLSLPADLRYTNHVGSVHASALLALAEASSGEYLSKRLPDQAGEVIPLVRRIEAKFKKPAFGAIYSKVNLPFENRDVFLKTLHARGRASIEIPVEIFDQHDSHAMSCTVEWFISKTQKPNQAPEPTPPSGVAHL